MRKILLVLVTVAWLFGMVGNLGASVLDFEDYTWDPNDTPTGGEKPVKSPYHGFNFSENAWWMTKGHMAYHYPDVGSSTGYDLGTFGNVSIFTAQLGGYQNPSPISMSLSEGTFSFYGAYITSAWKTGHNARVEGWRQGILIYSTELTGLSYDTPYHLSVDWKDIDTLKFIPGIEGTYHWPGREGDQIVIDNIQFNRAPVVSAGADQTVNEGDLVTLSGFGADDSDTLTYQWVQLAGPQVTLSDKSTPNPSFKAPSVDPGGSTLTFKLTVSDGELSGWHQVNITVKNVNQPPVADAGSDSSVKEGSLVELDGSGSYDPDGETLTYSWRQTAGPEVTLSGDNTSKTSFTAPDVGQGGEKLIFELTVSDGIESSTDSVVIFVENVNHSPIADAGRDQTNDEGSTVTLDGSGSKDPNNDTLTFSWTQISGPPVDLSDPRDKAPTFTAPEVTEGGAQLVFSLVVNDGFVDSYPDKVCIFVRNINDPPVCGLAVAKPNRLWPPNHKMVPVEIVGVTDPDNNNVAITITGVTQDEPVNGLGDGDTGPDAVIQGNNKVLLRAERAGGGNGRVYQIAFTATDANGATCSGAVSVCVPHDKKDGACQDDGQFFDSEKP